MCVITLLFSSFVLYDKLEPEAERVSSECLLVLR